MGLDRGDSVFFYGNDVNYILLITKQLSTTRIIKKVDILYINSIYLI